MKKLIIFLFTITSCLFAGVGDSAEDFTLDKLGGGTVSLSDFDGRVLYIFWFGHGCPYCDDNMRLAELNVTRQYSGDVFGAIGIDTWAGSNMTNVAGFQASTANNSLPSGVTFPLLINGQSLASDYGVTYDRSMVVDQQGIIRYYGGSHSEHNWADINNVIQELLATDIKPETISPYRFDLKVNYPNPFNPQTNIPFTIDQTQKVKLEIFNISGQLIETLLNATFAAGSYKVLWNAADNKDRPVPSGIYFIRLSGERIIKTRQIIYLK